MNGLWLFHLFLIFGTWILVKTENGPFEIDPAGYILYCPCMGRFGNQADQFLGSLAFSHRLNRTLVLPPWVEYHEGRLSSIQVPFNKYFDVDALKEYHRVIVMEDFMNYLGATVWPTDKRIALCYTNRASLKGTAEISCNPKDGNPFKSFWDTFNIDFVGSDYFGPLTYDCFLESSVNKWHDKYPHDKWPVLAFTGAPGNFPVKEENVRLHKYLIWSENIRQIARKFILTKMMGQKFIGIHLRNGIDWINACAHIKSSPKLFSAPQCLGYRNENGNATTDMCMPPQDLIIKQLLQSIKEFKRKRGEEIRAIFVASDNNHMINELNKSLHKYNVTAHKYTKSDPHIDLAILGMSDHFIANCISSFSAFAVRERHGNGLPYSFWGFPIAPISDSIKRTSIDHEEL